MGSHLVDSQNDKAQSYTDSFIIVQTHDENPFIKVNMENVKFPIGRTEFLERYESLMTMQE